MDGLKSGVILVVACTSLLSVALDLGNVICGIHFGYPQNMVDYVQEIGRLGRAPGCMADSWVVAWRGFQEKYPRNDISSAKQVRYDVNQLSYCWQKPLGNFFDGLSMPCGMHGRVVNVCDNCRNSCHMLTSTSCKSLYIQVIFINILQSIAGDFTLVFPLSSYVHPYTHLHSP